MKRHKAAESGICGTGIGHMMIGLQKDKGIAACIDAEQWYADEARKRRACARHQRPVIVAAEESGVVLL